MRNLLLNAATWFLSLVPTASASLVLLSGPSLLRASLNLPISPSPHLDRAVDVPRCFSLSAASRARCSLASHMCCSRMCCAHERADGKVRGQNGHAFSPDPTTSTGGDRRPVCQPVVIRCRTQVGVYVLAQRALK